MFLVFLVLIAFLIFGVRFFVKSKELKVEYEEQTSILLGAEVNNIDNINVKNGTIKTEKEQINTSKIGKQEISFVVEDLFGKEKEFKRVFIIEDKEPPKIQFKEKIEVSYGAEANLLKDVVATDNSNEEIEVKVEGDFDTYKPQEYELEYVAKDSSGNETREKFTLVVKEKYITY